MGTHIPEHEHVVWMQVLDPHALHGCFNMLCKTREVVVSERIHQFYPSSIKASTLQKVLAGLCIEEIVGRFGKSSNIDRMKRVSASSNNHAHVFSLRVGLIVIQHHYCKEWLVEDKGFWQ